MESSPGSGYNSQPYQHVGPSEMGPSKGEGHLWAHGLTRAHLGPP